MRKDIVDLNENKEDSINKKLKSENISHDEDKKILIINGQECEFIRSVPGIGFKSKEEEEEFVKNLFNYEDEDNEYDIYNTPNMGLKA